METPKTAATLRERQGRAFQAILTWMLRVVATLSGVLLAMAAIAGFQIEIVALALGMATFAASIALARKTLRQGQPRASLVLTFVPMFALAAGITLFFHDGSYLIILATIIAMLMVGMVASVRAAAWVTGGGLAAFAGFIVLAKLGAFDRLSGAAGGVSDFLTPVIAAAALIFLGLLAYILNGTLLGALEEAEQRRAAAEAARRELEATLDRVSRQSADQERLLHLVRDLETPIIPLLEGVLVLPVVGHLDSERISALTAALLGQVAARHARMVLVDLTGVSLIDTGTANRLLRLAQGVRLLGAEVMLTGIRAEVAQTLVTLGVSLGGIKTAASLQAGILQVSSELRHGL